MNTKANTWQRENTAADYNGKERRNSTFAPGSKNATDNTWRPLQLLNLYRLLISGGFFALLLAERQHNIFNDVNTAPLIVTSFVYLACAIVFARNILRHKPRFDSQVVLHIVTDVVAITLLAHFSGGFGNDIAVLLAVSVAGGSVLTNGRNALFFAALASFAVLAESLYSQFAFSSNVVTYTHAGILGITFFATAILATTLARRIKNSESLAEQRGSDLLTMEQLTRYVIQRLQTGVLVLDGHNRPRLMNQSTRQLLAIDDDNQHNCLDINPELNRELQRWQADPEYQPQAIPVRQGAHELLPRFAKLGRKHENSGTLIFLEDTTALAQQAQQLKLASLGRLTASIAHEIRNPLGAISHAGQLLAESAEIHKNDKRLTEIISQQSKRLDKIVDNVMQLSQRKAAHSEAIDLFQWLQQIKKEFCHHMAINEDSIPITLAATPARVVFDPSHLHQVVWNLCANALRHGQADDSNPRIELRLANDGHDYLPTLDVIDNGPGIKKELLDTIFEPFFTTNHNGTGLGLYIARELCANNQARLHYVVDDNHGACFRISFADTRRQHQAA